MIFVAKAMVGVVVFLCVTLAVAITLALAIRPAKPDPRQTLDFTSTLDASTANGPTPSQFEMRDGTSLDARYFEGQGETVPLLVLIQGSGWYDQQFDALGTRLSEEGLADVLAPDLRGHGPQAKPRGDVAYIGQLEDDLADLIAAVVKPGQRVILAGHSSGGGLVIRFAGGPHGEMLDGAILLAPFVQHDAPTMRTNAGGWSSVSVPRLIGLSILNGFRIRLFNHLEVIRFNFPKAVTSRPRATGATEAYSYRLNTSFAPHRDYGADIAALPPFHLIVGDRDEAFVPDAYGPLFKRFAPDGTYHLVPGVSHLEIVDHDTTYQVIASALSP